MFYRNRQVLKFKLALNRTVGAANLILIDIRKYDYHKINYKYGKSYYELLFKVWIDLDDLHIKYNKEIDQFVKELDD